MTAVQPVLSRRTSIQPVLSIKAVVQSIWSKMTAVQPVLYRRTSIQPVLSIKTVVQSIWSKMTAVQPVLYRRTVVKSILSKMMAVQPVLSRRTSLQSVLSRKTVATLWINVQSILSKLPAVQSVFSCPEVPVDRPVITGVRPRYKPGEVLHGNCSSSWSRPAARLAWFINGEQAPVSTLVAHPTLKEPGGDKELSVLGLRILLTHAHFPSGRLKIRCTGSLAHLYWQSTENSVEVDRPRGAAAAALQTDKPPPGHLDMDLPGKNYVISTWTYQVRHKLGHTDMDLPGEAQTTSSRHGPTSSTWTCQVRHKLSHLDMDLPGEAQTRSSRHGPASSIQTYLVRHKLGQLDMDLPGEARNGSEHKTIERHFPTQDGFCIVFRRGHPPGSFRKSSSPREYLVCGLVPIAGGGQVKLLWRLHPKQGPPTLEMNPNKEQTKHHRLIGCGLLGNQEIGVNACFEIKAM
uniref:Ig-like domain-containing protein n=1 Tax=Timema bartmani TaxID=61472 RepID=A0A7R9EXV4_9NEOP|nr:unnamed protein product [Timema bartmani]